jgi:aspartyl-tRNA(Asn)/glutamyl-tRNA(Gln) amidotransferase subunit A
VLAGGAIVMNAICGKDPCDATSLDVPTPDFTKALVNDVKGLKIGVPQEFFGMGTDPEVDKAVKAAVDVLVGLGAEYKETSMPSVKYGIATYYIIAPAECSSNLARYDGVRYGLRSKHSPDVIKMFENTREEGFGAEVKQRIMIGTYALSAGYYDAYYLKAQKVRTLLRQDFEKAFEEFDVLISPTSPGVAFGIGELAALELAHELEQHVLELRVRLAVERVGVQLVVAALAEERRVTARVGNLLRDEQIARQDAGATVEQ